MRDFPTVELRLLHSDRFSALSLFRGRKIAPELNNSTPPVVCEASKLKVSLCTAKATHSQKSVVYISRVSYGFCLQEGLFFHSLT